MPRIAISYRRDETGIITGRIFDRLVAHYGKDSVFLDIDNIPAGTDYRKHIAGAVENTDILLAVIGPKWIGPRTGQVARINDATDPVRVEIELALRLQTTVIPVLVENARMPTVADLPPSLSELAFRNAVKVDSLQDFDHHIDRLIRQMDRVRPTANTGSSPRIPRQATPAESRRHRLFGTPLVVGLAVLLVIIASGIWYFSGYGRRELVRSATSVGSPSIVVLPFENLGAASQNDYLADVLTDELTTCISRIPGTFVIARNTAFTFKGKAVDVKEIGGELGVRYALEGSVQSTSDRVRVNAQLIDTQSGGHLWAEQFDHARSDLLQMQDEIVTRLARTLQIQLAQVETARLEHTRPANLSAQELAMRCEVTVWNFGFFGEQARKALPLCVKALEIDPNNVVALVDLATASFLQVLSAQSEHPQEDIAHADKLVSRALAIDPNSSTAHSARAGVLLAQQRFDESEEEARRAVALNPSQMDAYNVLCSVTLYTGHAETSIGYVEKALLLSPRDPLRFVWLAVEGWDFVMLHQDDRAADVFRRSLAINPYYDIAQASLAAVLALNGHETEARVVLATYMSMPATRTRTVSAFKQQHLSDDPAFLAMREHLYAGLLKAGMPEN